MTETERYSGTTDFQIIYDAFEDLVTDDMYLEWDKDETSADLKNILKASISKFEFPTFKLYDYELIDNEDGTFSIGDKFNFILTLEEITIFATLMIVEWMTRQMATANLTKQIYSTADFKMTSQANHIVKLIALQKAFKTESTYLQRLYKRRKVDGDGYIKPNFNGLGGKSNVY